MASSKLPSTIGNWHTTSLYFHSPAADLGEIILAGTGTLKQSQERTNRVGGSWAFVLIVEGEGEWNPAGADSRPLNAGDWFLLFPDVPHSYKPSGVWKEFYLVFRGPLFEVWRDSGYLVPQRAFGKFANVEEAWAELRSAVNEMLSKKNSSWVRLSQWQNYIARLCAKAPKTDASVDNRLQKACALIEEHMTENDVDYLSIAGSAGMSYSNMRRLFQLHLKTSPSRFRETARIQKAVRLMQTHHFSCSKLAELLGYYDTAHFSRAFKSFTGRGFSEVSKFPRTILTKKND